jgi:uncharacterized protein (TIGR02453 family)
MKKKGNTYFGEEFFGFLTELRVHNNRDWFLQNKDRYESAVREPFLRLIADLAPLLKQIPPGFIADPRPVGGSMMRIYRDIRFSRDKSPYKTSVAAHFYPSTGGEAAPALYLHLEPGDCAVGAGIWRPQPAPLKQIRDAIVAQPKRWRQATSGKEFRSSCGMFGESLKRPPTGYPPDHPFIEDLKRKDFTISSPLTDDQVCRDGLLDEIVEKFKVASPFVQFLCAALETASPHPPRSRLAQAGRG